ncbi:MAG TPA: hypothetical protein VGH58_04075 [Solirubrobacterales bacterium]|jgi:hypothetical protein
MPVADVSNFTVGVLGVVGVMITLAVTLILPAAVRLANGSAPPQVTLGRVIGWLLVLVIYAAAGAVAALYIGDAGTEKEAVYYGMAWQAVIGGVIKSGQAFAAT